MISIIIPVFNNEKHIERSIESAVNQTFSDLEIIIVDDGSTDLTPLICDSWAKKDSRLKIIHKNNGGISSARNSGINTASGDYIIFLDSDDYLDLNTCEIISNIIKVYRPDCIDFGWNYVNINGETTSNINGIEKEILLDNNYIMSKIIPPLINLVNDTKNFIYDFSVTLVYRRKILNDYNVRFIETRRIWEDRPFKVMYLNHCNNIYSLNRSLYYYVQMPNSLSSHFRPELFRIIVENYQIYSSLFDKQFDFMGSSYSNGYWCKSIEKMIIRSFNEKNNTETIRLAIIDAFDSDEIQRCYKNRKNKNLFDYCIRKMILIRRYDWVINVLRINLWCNNTNYSIYRCFRSMLHCLKKFIIWR